MGHASSRASSRADSQADSRAGKMTQEVHNVLDVKLNKGYTHLIFNGTSGVYSQLGVVAELMKQDYLNNVRTITSAGPSCILALLLALGYTIDEILHFYQECDFEDMYSSKTELQSDICHFAVNLGRNNGQELTNVITKIIEKRTGNKNYTLGDLFSDRGFTLNLIITDLTLGSYVILNHVAHANVPLRIAVRIASGYAPQIAPVIYDDHYFTGVYEMMNIGHIFFRDDPQTLNIETIEDRTELMHTAMRTPFDLLDAFRALRTPTVLECESCTLRRIAIKTKNMKFTRIHRDRFLSEGAAAVRDWQ